MSDTLFERINTGDLTSYAFGGVIWVAQMFTVGQTGYKCTQSITSVKLKLYRVGNPGTLNVVIENSDVGGGPGSASLAYGSMDGNTLTTDTAGAWYEIPITGVAPLAIMEAGTKYALVCYAAAAPAFTSIHWRDSGTAGINGAWVSVNSGAKWASISTNGGLDFMFEEYGIQKRLLTLMKHW